MAKQTRPARRNQFDRRFHPWPGWPDGAPWCTRCTFEPKDEFERRAEALVERMHMYAMHVRTEPHQIGEGYNNLVRMVADELRLALPPPEPGEDENA